jgi:hypothetical protein
MRPLFLLGCHNQQHPRITMDPFHADYAGWNVCGILGYVPDIGDHDGSVRMCEFHHPYSFSDTKSAPYVMHFYRYLTEDKPIPDWTLSAPEFRLPDASTPGMSSLQVTLDATCAKANLKPIAVPPGAGVVPINYERWMSQMADSGLLENGWLQYLCLPGTHDSATSNLQLKLTDAADQTLIKLTDDTLDTVRAIVGAFAAIPPWLFTIPAAIYLDHVVGAIKDTIFHTIFNLAQATGNGIDRQLKDGVRAFDLRVYFNRDEKKFYSVHSLEGENYETILDKVSVFLASHPGEIVYLWFRAVPHPGGFDGDDVLANFGKIVYDKLGKYALHRSELHSGLSPFKMRYKELVGSAHGCARTVIQFDKLGLDDKYEIKGPGHEVCFKPSELDLLTKASADYPEKPDVVDMLTKEQVIKYQIKWYEQAKQGGKTNRPFMTWLTIPTSNAAATDIGYCDAKRTAAHLAPWPISKIIDSEWHVHDRGWRTLRDIAEPLDKDLAESIHEIIPLTQDRSRTCILSGIHLDFYEITNLVNLAIARSCIQSILLGENVSIHPVPELATVGDHIR